MSHLPVLPFVIPLIASTILLMLHTRGMELQRGISLASALLGLAAALLLVHGAGEGTITVYALGNWPPPYGIALVVDRLAALMVLLVFLLAIPALLMASSGWDQMGRHFH
ncbi:MAG: monovalent cation/H+ antiporter subunit D, partial [Thermaurantiacus sp.]